METPYKPEREEVNRMPTARKKEAVKELQDLFTKSQVLIFTDYRGLSVSEITNLRRQLREKGVEYHVSKNTLTSLAADHAGMESMKTMLDGPTAIAFVGDDIPGAAKVLGDFARTSRILQIRGGLVGSSVLNAEQVSDLTKILPREQYVAKLLGSMQMPISGMMGVLTGVMRGFVNVLQARADQMKEQGADTSAPAGAEASTAEAEAQAMAEAEAPAAETPTTETPTTEVASPAAPSAPEEPRAEAAAPAATAEVTAEASAEASATPEAPEAVAPEAAAAPEAEEPSAPAAEAPDSASATVETTTDTEA